MGGNETLVEIKCKNCPHNRFQAAWIAFFVVLHAVGSFDMNLHGVEADVTGFQIAKVMGTPSTLRPNLTHAEVQASKILRSDSTIAIVRADKSNATVVLNTDDYNKKMMDHISNGPYVKVNNQRTVLSKLKAETISLTRIVKPKLDKTTAFRLYLKTNICPRMYGLPKIHKRPNTANCGLYRISPDMPGHDT